jgi:hemolysin D
VISVRGVVKPARTGVAIKSDDLSRAVAPPGPTAVNPALATRDSEFLPAAIEILVTPPSPITMWLMMMVSAIVLAGLAWSYFGWLDIQATAPGKIQFSGRSKLVQPLESGKVAAIHVQSGSRVNAGDLLVELDATEAVADRDALARDLHSARAEAARRYAAIHSAQRPSLEASEITFEPEIPGLIRQRENGVLLADLRQLKSSLDSLMAEIAEKRATTSRLEASIAARERLIALSRERVSMREEIKTLGAGSRALVIEALQQLEGYITSDVAERGQLTETAAAVVSLHRRADQAVSAFIADQVQKLVDVERRRDRLIQELVKAQARVDRARLAAPIGGTVQQLNLTTIGQVVTTGQALMTIVPFDGRLEVEAQVANKDIGFLWIGQPAVVKVETFPFTRYGVIDAQVARISRDAVDDREAAMTADAAANRAQSSAGTTRAQNLVFPVALELKRQAIQIDGREVPLIPGMAVSVEIRTGKRRAIDYILSPLREVVSQTAHER